ncbi:hypothetical protein AB0D46_26130 [Streptomyces sp. NPDC048383]|uniref:hypothetical protein n=1 Tax=Streptomyces sp. NPDC048383 TaxID=3155386 RepID=UPI003433E1A3
MSGSNLHQISRWNQMGRLPAGRALFHVAQDTADGAVRDSRQAAAMALRESSKSWTRTAKAWEADRGHR